MATSEPGDEEDLFNFWGGIGVFNSWKKKRQRKGEKKNKYKARDIMSRKTAKLLIFRRQFRFLREKTHLFETMNWKKNS